MIAEDERVRMLGRGPQHEPRLALRDEVDGLLRGSKMAISPLGILEEVRSTPSCMVLARAPVDVAGRLLAQAG
jgi:hypothetical protein